MRVGFQSALPEVLGGGGDRAVRFVSYIRREQRTCPDFPAVDAARDAAARVEELFERHQIVEHLDDAAASEAEIDAALEIVACRIAQDGRELALAARLTLKIGRAHV